MNLALFGGSFDPVHNGHLAIARAAQERFALKQILFVPASVSPFKMDETRTPYVHRYAMLTAALAGEKTFVPSLLEHDPEERPSFTIDTIRRFRRTLKAADHLYFLCGIDAFLTIAKWREPEELLRSVEFIIASRPGYSMADIASALPEPLRPSDAVLAASKRQKAAGQLVLKGTILHLLEDVNERVSSTQVREAIESRRSLKRLVPVAVEEYIRKTGLYQTAAGAATLEKPARAKVLRMPAARHRT